MLTPIPISSRAADNEHMAKLAVRCHPCAPLALGDFERWLELLADDLRSDLPDGGGRLLRLTQRSPRSDLEVGWLLEVELGASHCPSLLDRITSALTEMRLLGLQTTLLAPRDLRATG